MHQHLQMRVASNERADDPRMIEVHVRQEDVHHVRETDAEPVQSEFERVEARCRSRIDERDTSGVTDNGRRDDVRTASKLQIDPAKAGCKNGHALGEALY